MNTTALNSVRTPQTPMQDIQRQQEIRKIVREEIKRAEKLKELEQKHQSGEISDFEYKAQKFLLEAPVVFDKVQKAGVVYSTTA